MVERARLGHDALESPDSDLLAPGTDGNHPPTTYLGCLITAMSFTSASLNMAEDLTTLTRRRLRMVFGLHYLLQPPADK